MPRAKRLSVTFPVGGVDILSLPSIVSSFSGIAACAVSC